MLYSIINRVAKLPMVSEIVQAAHNFLRSKWKQVNLSVEEAEQKVLSVYTKTKSTTIWKRIHEEKVDLSIIIPFYKTEKFAIRCIESVLNQNSQFAVEVILVDDGSPDNCGVILDSYRNRENVIVIHQKNSGLSSARNVGLIKASGQYVMFVDSDDILLPGAVDVLVNTAKKYHADIVEGGYYTFTDKGKKKVYSHPFMVGKQGEGMFGYPCGKVFRSSLFDSVCFPVGYWYEDTIISAFIHRNAGITVRIPELVFGYYVNHLGITAQTKKSIKCIDSLFIIDMLLRDTKKRNEVLSTSIMRAYLYQLGTFLFFRTYTLDVDLQKAVFILVADLAERYGLCDVATNNYYENELICALKNKQYDRWKWASILI